MVKYRQANTTNLVVGVVLILLGVGGLVNLVVNNVSGVNLFWPLVFVLVFVLMGGYETGKYAESRHRESNSKPKPEP